MILGITVVAVVILHSTISVSGPFTQDRSLPHEAYNLDEREIPEMETWISGEE